MKVLTLIALLAVTATLGKTHMKSKSRTRDVTIPATPGEQAFISGAYSYSHPDGFILQDAAGFKTPKYTDKIARIVHNPYTGIITQADRIPTDRFYYDGRTNLLAEHIDCNLWTLNPPKCLGNASCGWCSSSSKCIAGNAVGPLGNCFRSSYLYSMPSREWNPLKAGHINLTAKDRSGRNAMEVVPTPSLNEIHNNSPYVY